MKKTDFVSASAERVVIQTDLPPTTNNLYYTDKTGKRRLTPAARAYKSIVRGLLDSKMARRRGPDHPYCLKFWVYFPDNRSDASNRIKALEDAITEAMGVNDVYVYELHVYKMIDPDSPRIIAELTHSSRVVKVKLHEKKCLDG